MRYYGRRGGEYVSLPLPAADTKAAAARAAGPALKAAQKRALRALAKGPLDAAGLARALEASLATGHVRLRELAALGLVGLSARGRQGRLARLTEAGRRALEH